jgi:hypothetical protein
MKKYVWLLVAAAFAVAVLAMVGCRPAETPTPSPSPTVTPTPAVVGCPVVQRTVAYNAYDPDGDYVGTKILLYLTNPIAFSANDCLEDPDYWVIEVENDGRGGTLNITIEDVDLELNGSVVEVDTYIYEVDGGNRFDGLICSTEDAEDYAEAMDLANAPTSPDLVTVTLDSSCILYNELGEECCDGLEGEACCTVICPEPTPTPICPPM